MSTRTDDVTETEWDTIRMALELVDLDDCATSEHASDCEFAVGVERLYEKLQRMGLI